MKIIGFLFLISLVKGRGFNYLLVIFWNPIDVSILLFLSCSEKLRDLLSIFIVFLWFNLTSLSNLILSTDGSESDPLSLSAPTFISDGSLIN